MIYVICLMDGGWVGVDVVRHLKLSHLKPYALKWTYTTNKSEVEFLKSEILK